MPDQSAPTAKPSRGRVALPGLAAGVVVNGDVVVLHGLGHADIEEGVPFAPSTPCRIASVSKTLSATVIVQLIEAGVLSLDTSMAAFPGPARYREKPVLVRHLLSHTGEDKPGEVPPTGARG